MNGIEIRQLTPADVPVMRQMLDMFGRAFGDTKAYCKTPPSSRYLAQLLGSDSFIALAAVRRREVVGGLAAYELRKFEQERSELYIYDLAVAATHRRKGIASALIARLQAVAAERGAYVVYVQADLADSPPIALYSKIGMREDVLHFDIPVAKKAQRRSNQASKRG